jgi:hypothetical protein
MLAFGIVALILISMWATFSLLGLIRKMSNNFLGWWEIAVIVPLWLLGFGVPIAYIAMTLGRV